MPKKPDQCEVEVEVAPLDSFLLDVVLRMPVAPDSPSTSTSSIPFVENSFLSDYDELDADERVKHYEIQRILARGGGGTVLLATDTRNGQTVALKHIVHSTSLSRLTRSAVSEAMCLAKLHHRNVLNVIEVIHGKHSTYLAMPYITGGPLGHLRCDNTCVTTTSRATLGKHFRDVVSALRYIHSMGFYHKDVKPDNILIDSENRAILCDFHECEVSESGQSTIPCGTLCFRPPETIDLDEGVLVYDLAAADVWCLGCTFYCLLFGVPPYPDSGYISTCWNIQQNPCVIPNNCPPQWHGILSRMLDKNPKTRARLSDLEHEMANMA